MMPEIPELSATERQRRTAIASTLHELGKLARSGELDDEALVASLNQLAHLGAAHDIDSLHIPEDAGEYRAQLVALMLRIPDRRRSAQARSFRAGLAR